jgi:putative glycosyltransferase (TIGR04372 family)
MIDIELIRLRCEAEIGRAALGLKSMLRRLRLLGIARSVFLRLLVVQLILVPRLVRLGILKYEVLHPSILARMGNAALARGSHELAMQVYLAALRQQPEDVLLRLQIGVTAFLAGQYRECEKWFASLERLKRRRLVSLGFDNSKYRIMDTTWTPAIGHVAFLDTYIKACRLGWLPAKQALLAYDPSKPPPGWPLFRYFDQYITILRSSSPDDAIDEVIHGPDFKRLDPSHRDHTRAALSEPFWFGPDASGQIRWFAPYAAAVETAAKASKTRPLAAVSVEDRNRFRCTMQDVYGLPANAWFVVLHVREPGYHATWHKHHPGTRNADIRTYDKVIDFVLAHGGWVVRAGDPSMGKIHERDMVLDYATSRYRSPEIDIMLCAECTYFIGTNSGLSLVPPVFGKRCALTNWSPIGITNWYKDDIYVPKLVRKGYNGRYLSFTELFSSVAGWSQFMRDFNNGLVIEDNKPDDLLSVVEELHAEVFDFTRDVTQKDVRRLKRFNDIVVSHGSYIGSRMSYRFLDKYEQLLE